MAEAFGATVMKSQLIMFFAAAACSVSAFAQEVTIEPDAAMQAQIGEFVEVFAAAKKGPAGERDVQLALERLLAAANGDRKFLMLQTIYSAGHTEDPDLRLYAKFVFIYFIEWLALSDEECLEIALPYLTNRTPYSVRYFTRGILVHIYLIEVVDSTDTYDFSFFANRIANQSDQAPRALDNLIDFIYYEGPGEAVLALMRAHGASSGEIVGMEEAEKWLGPMYRRGFRTGRDPEWDLDRIMGYLDTYSQSEHWWERLYVATMLGKVRKLRTDPVIRRLKSDQHPVIRGKLTRIRPKDE